MHLSQETDKLFDALATFQGTCPTVAKDATVKVKTRNGGSYTFDYATLGNILETTKETLAENGLSVIQFTESAGVSTMITHKSGQWLKTEGLKLSADPRFDKNGNELPPTPQDVGSTLTYAKRYQLSGVLKVDAMDDDDANVASGNTAEKKAPAKKAKKTPKKEAKKAPEKKDSGNVDLSSAESPAQAIEALKDEHGDNIDAVRSELLKWYTAKQKEDSEFKQKYHSEMMTRMQDVNLEAG